MSMRVGSVLVGAATLAALAPRALAHDGHGNPQLFGSVLHYFFEPIHLPLVLAVSVVIVLAIRWVSNRRLQRAARSRRR
jgi:hypothetical protein